MGAVDLELAAAKMGYAIIRTQKLKHGQAVRRSMAHALRSQDTPNADPSRLSHNDASAATVDEALERFNERLATQAKVRKNAVLAVEYLVTASPEAMSGKSREEQDAYFADALRWLEDKHGKENVVAWGIHRDETTPHMYALVVPLDDKFKLNCRHYLGGAKALGEMQTDFAQKVGLAHELERGLERSKARHVSIREYYARVNEATPKTPGIAMPEPAGLLESKKDFGRRCMDAVLAQVGPERKALTAKAAQGELDRRRLAELDATARELRGRADRLKETADRLYSVASLFTPDEIRAAQNRKQQDAENARRAEIERQKAAEVAEFERRVRNVANLSRSAGVEHTFAKKAAEALKNAGGDAGRVDWRAVELLTTREAIAKHGQSAASVAAAINKHSPGRIDPASHGETKQAIERAAPALELEYTQRQQKTRGLSR